MKTFKSIELFAGAGGLALGLEQAGLNHIGLVEFDKFAAETLRTNRPEWNVICEDIENVAQRDLEKEFNLQKGELDLLSGGAPCQSFSYAGKRLGLEDIRGTMFYHYAAFLHKLQPKMFLFENVKGLLTHDKGKTYQTILSIFEDEGYDTNYKVLNAWDFGVPQKRERLITVGIRKDLSDKISFQFPKPHKYKPLIKDIVLDTNPDTTQCARYSEYKAKIFSLVPPGGYWRDINPEIAKEYMKSCWDMEGGRTGILRRIGLDEPSLTVLTSPGMKQTDRCHPLEVRPFSYRENARIQTFPDSWIFCGKLSDKYRQVGNAVPVNLAKEIGTAIVKSLESCDKMFSLSFIEENSFKKHVQETIAHYRKSSHSMTLNSFNSNVIDPIKLLFDKSVWQKSFEEILNLEIYRQRDKSNTNAIGYFHQNIFRYIKDCTVPLHGWDVIVEKNGYKIFVEMKNKHNTMNSSSSQKTYIQMQNQILQSPNDYCFLVEAIAPLSRNIPWVCSVNGQSCSNEHIRRVSIDKFYHIVTGIEDAFYQMCMQLPDTITELLEKDFGNVTQKDTVIEELKNNNKDMLKSLYLLAFSTYNGFDKLQ